MAVFWELYEFILCIIDVVLIYIFLAKVCKIRIRYNRLITSAGSMGTALLLFIITHFKLFSVFGVLITLLLTFAYVMVFFKDSLWKKAICFVFAFAILGLSDLITSFIITALTGKSFNDIGLNQNIYRISYMMSSKTVTVLLSFIWMQLRKGDKGALPPRYKVIFLFISMSSIITILFLLNIVFGTEANKQGLENSIVVVFSATLLFTYGIVCYLFNQMCLHFTNKSINENMEFQKETLIDITLRQEKAKDEIRILSHDMKHLLIDLKIFLLDGNIKEALKLISAYESKINVARILDAGVPIISAFINRTYQEACNNSIKFKFDGFLDDDILIDPIELGSLFGNILDNALEASLNVKDLDKREICVRLKREKQFLFLYVENNYEIEPVEKNSVFITNKANSINHGIGIRSIRKIVKKYDGSVDFDYYDGRFKVFAILPVYRQ